ncbi:MAG: hypothetical protein L3J70_06145 [Gammaproteobacteria bacterium]|nr:hypothetical protein [Gammaproteobacteria bacterium]
MTSPTKMVAFGVDQRSREMLRMVFAGPGNGMYELAEESVATAAIINMDSLGAEELLIKYRKRHPSLPTILIAIKRPELEQQGDSEFIFVQKPMRVDRLIKALACLPVSEPKSPQPPPATLSSVKVKQATRETQRLKRTRNATKMLESMERSSTTQEIDSYEENREESIYFDASDLLLGYLLQARNQAFSSNQPVRIEDQLVGGVKPITLLPKSAEVVTSMTDDELKSLCFVKLDNAVNIRPFTTEQSDAIDPSAEKQSLESFIWKVAIWTSNGRVPEGTQVAAHTSLKQWPNFTRLMMTPNALRISALWNDRPYSPLLVAKVLKVPVQHVFSFYTAAHSIGLINTAVQKSSTSVDVKKHKHRSLFKRILSHIKRSG